MPDLLVYGLLPLAAMVLVGYLLMRLQRWSRESIARGDEREIRARLVNESPEAMLAETDTRIDELRARFRSVSASAGQASVGGGDPLAETNRELHRRLAYRAKILDLTRKGR